MNEWGVDGWMDEGMDVTQTLQQCSGEFQPRPNKGESVRTPQAFDVDLTCQTIDVHCDCTWCAV